MQNLAGIFGSAGYLWILRKVFCWRASRRTDPEASEMVRVSAGVIALVAGEDFERDGAGKVLAGAGADGEVRSQPQIGRRVAMLYASCPCLSLFLRLPG